MGDSSKSGTRVFKKSSPNGRITAYLGKRDFVDHIHCIDPIDGIVLIDEEYLKCPEFSSGAKKVMATLTCAFRYGREDLDVLGLTFRKELHTDMQQVYPPTKENERRLCTRLQERLLRKLGKNAYPFFFELPLNSPCSVTLQPAPGDTGKPCGVDYELKACILYEGEEPQNANRKNSVRLAIRKVQYAPDRQAPQPCREISTKPVLSDKPINLEATLDKELYYHGETMSVNVQITNNSSRSVKKIKISVRQFADICIYSSAQYKCPVANLEHEVCVPPSSTLCKVFQITPNLSENKDKRGLALDGQLKHEDTNLASTTLIKDGISRETLGIVVSYKVKVKLVMGGLAADVSLFLPFSLMHSKPVNDSDNQRRQDAQDALSIRQEINSTSSRNNSYSKEPKPADQPDKKPAPDAESVHLINFDDPLPATNTGFEPMPGQGWDDDELQFMEFTRLRLNNAHPEQQNGLPPPPTQN